MQFFLEYVKTTSVNLILIHESWILIFHKWHWKREWINIYNEKRQHNNNWLYIIDDLLNIKSNEKFIAYELIKILMFIMNDEAFEFPDSSRNKIP